MNEGSTYPFHFHPFIIQGKVKVVGNLFSHPNFQYPTNSNLHSFLIPISVAQKFQSAFIPHTTDKSTGGIRSSPLPVPFSSKKDRQSLVKFHVLSRSLPVQNIPRVFLKRIRIQWPIVTQLQPRLVQSANQARVTY